MSKATNETGNVALLAQYDLLDPCLLGENGTCKTHTARLIHDLSPRTDKPFVAVNCAEFTPSIIEAELFGYEKGVSTAQQIRRKASSWQPQGSFGPSKKTQTVGIDGWFRFKPSGS